MIENLIIIVSFLILIIAVVWLPFIRQIINHQQQDKKPTAQQTSEDEHIDQRDAANVRLYHEHKEEIEQDYQQEKIDEESYRYLLDELDQSLLQDIEANKAEDKNLTAKDKSLSVIWPSVISLFIIVFSFVLYLKTGAYQQLTSTEQASAQSPAQAPGETVQQQAIDQVKHFKALTAQNSEDSEAWYGLGQALVGVGQFDFAMTAFDQVIRIEGEHADIIGVKAQAAYYRNGQKIDGTVQALIDKALALDPLDPSTNILLGMHNYMMQNYQQAVAYWQKVHNSGRSNVNVEALGSAINEAKNRLLLSGGQINSSEFVQDAENSGPQLSGPQLKLKVTLSEELLRQVNQGEDKVVFVYAIPTDGRRMPLAAVKIKASDLPTTVILNDTSAMMPEASLSSVKSVNLYAVLSNSGGAGIKKGDFKAQVNDVSVNTIQVIHLAIDSIVP